jgi:hypothetical protein
MPLTTIRGPWRKELGLKEALNKIGRYDYPILCRALENAEPAHSTEVKWSTRRKDRKGNPIVWFNRTQIFRNKFGVSYTQWSSRFYGSGLWAQMYHETLEKHLQQIETTLMHGTLQSTGGHFIDAHGQLQSVCHGWNMGGAKFYLQRPPANDKDDYLGLRILQDTMFREYDQGSGQEGEFITELTLVVQPEIEKPKPVMTQYYLTHDEINMIDCLRAKGTQ